MVYSFQQPSAENGPRASVYTVHPLLVVVPFVILPRRCAVVLRPAACTSPSLYFQPPFRHTSLCIQRGHVCSIDLCEEVALRNTPGCNLIRPATCKYTSEVWGVCGPMQAYPSWAPRPPSLSMSHHLLPHCCSINTVRKKVTKNRPKASNRWDL